MAHKSSGADSGAHTTFDSLGNMSYGGNSSSRGHRRQGRGRGRGMTRYTNTSTRQTCQLCGHYGHSVLECWYRFDETFVPQPLVAQTTPNSASTQQQSTDAMATSTTPYVNLAEIMTLDATGMTSEFSIPSRSYHDNWYGDTRASHHVTPNAHNLQHINQYLGHETVEQWSWCFY